MHSHHAQRGFTLIEVLIVVALLGILASVAYPSYQEYVRRGHRAEARAELMKVAQWMERTATANGTYPVSTVTAQKTALDAMLSGLSGGTRYAYSVTSTTGSTYAAKAVPQGAQSQDSCGTLVLHHNGQQQVENASRTAAECWNK